MSYHEHDGRRSYNFGEHDFGAATETLGIQPPDGKRGRVVGCHVAATETFTAVTTEAAVQVGVSGTLNKFLDFGLGTTADATGIDASRQTGDIKNVEIETADVVLVTLKAPTGGTPAGKGHVTLDIQWY